MMKKILVILADQWRSDGFSFMNPCIKTPNVDRLVQRSTVYRNAFTTTPLCSPARACLLTALQPHKNGVLDNLGIGNSTQKPLSSDISTWIRAASKKGYRTAYFGKWHIGVSYLENENITLELSGERDRYARTPESPSTPRGELLPGRAYNYEPGVAEKPPFYRNINKSVAETFERRMTKLAIDFLTDDDGEQPYFLCVSYKAPHFPLDIPIEYHNIVQPEDIKLPDSLIDPFVLKPWYQNRHWWPCMATEDLSPEDWKKTIAAYYCMIAMVDHEIGLLLEHVDQDTIVVFTSDHGEMVGNHSRFDKGPYFYDDVMRVPLVIAGLGSPGMEDRFVSNLDVGATLFALLDETGSYDGNDLRKLGVAADADEGPEQCAYFYYNYYNGHAFPMRAIRTQEWMYSCNPMDIDELYDLKRDPHQITNLIDRDAYRDIVARLREQLKKHLTVSGDPFIVHMG